MSWRDIQVAYLSAAFLPATSGARILRPLGATGIPICDIEAACASGGVALRQAMLSLQSGAFETALVDFSQRQRRFGHTGEQIEKMEQA